MTKEELETVPFGLGEDNPFGKYFKGKSYLNILLFLLRLLYINRHTMGNLIMEKIFMPKMQILFGLNCL